MKTHALRLKQGQELKQEIINFVKDKNIEAGFIITCVGSLNKLTLRFSDEKIKTFNDKFEIISLSGTISVNGRHLHLSVADKEGKTIGGHLKRGIVYTTAEIVIGESENLLFRREFSKETNFKELIIETG